MNFDTNEFRPITDEEAKELFEELLALESEVTYMNHGISTYLIQMSHTIKRLRKHYIEGK
jgi:hypothetical protein